jgi:hypothetical protein
MPYATNIRKYLRKNTGKTWPQAADNTSCGNPSAKLGNKSSRRSLPDATTETVKKSLYGLNSAG